MRKFDSDKFKAGKENPFMNRSRNDEESLNHASTEEPSISELGIREQLTPRELENDRRVRDYIINNLKKLNSDDPEDPNSSKPQNPEKNPKDPELIKLSIIKRLKEI